MYNSSILYFLGFNITETIYYTIITLLIFYLFGLTTRVIAETATTQIDNTIYYATTAATITYFARC